MNLIHNKVKDNQDFNNYLSIVNSFEVAYPFYKVPNFNLSELSDKEFVYFTYGNADKILILMPFMLREITHVKNNHKYYDVISPYGYSGPLFNEHLSRAHLLDFWKHVDLWYKANNVVSEFVRFSLNNNHQFYTGKLIPTLSNVKGVIDFDEQKQWDNYKAKVRNNYRKAISNDLRFEIIQNSEYLSHVELFHNVYIKTMSRLGATKDYFYSLNYFKNIISLNKKNHAIAFVYKGDVVISVELIFIINDTLYSYLGGTISDYFSFRPNDFLKIEVVNWARKQGYKYYVLGGGRKDNDNLYKYKKTFFPDDEDVIYYTGRKIIDIKVYKELINYSKFNKKKDKLVKSNNNSDKNYFPLYRN